MDVGVQVTQWLSLRMEAEQHQDRFPLQRFMIVVQTCWEWGAGGKRAQPSS